MKVCMEKNFSPSFNFSYIGINEYLKDLPGEGFFYFCEKENVINYLIDNAEWGDFFFNKETM